MGSRFPPSKKLLVSLAAVLAACGVGGAIWVFRPGEGGRRPAASPRIEGLIAQGSIALALEEAEGLLALHPGDPWLNSTAGRLRFLIGDYPAGEEKLRAEIARKARPAADWLDLARLEEDAARLKDAARDAERALQADPGIAGARAIIARHLLAIDRFEEAGDLLAGRVQAGSADRDEVLTYGRALLRLGRHREASEVLGRTLALPPAAEDPADSRDAAFALAEALIGAGEFRRAADVLAERLEEDPMLPRGLYLLGTALARLGRRESARPVLKAYEELAKLEARWTKTQEMDRAGLRNRAAYERASVLAETYRFRRAIAECRRAVSITVSNRIDDGPVLLATAGLLGELEASSEAEEVLDRAASKGLQPAAGFLSLKGELLRRAGKMEEARTAFDRALAASPGDPDALIGRGRVALEGGARPEEAEAFFARARAQAPLLRKPVEWLARAAVARGDPARARELFLEALRLGEGMSAELLGGMGLSALRGGAAEEAVRLFLESLKLEPRSVEALRGLEEGMAALGDSARAAKAGELRARVEAIEALLARLRGSPARFEERSAAFLEIAGRARTANLSRDSLKLFHLAREASPASAGAQRALAEVLESPEDRLVRVQTLASLLRLSPGDVPARRGLALVLAQVGVRLERAADLARGALAAEDSPEGRYVLGEVLLAQGDLEGAAREAQAALRAKPGEGRYQGLARRALLAAGDRAAGSTGGAAPVPAGEAR